MRQSTVPILEPAQPPRKGTLRVSEAALLLFLAAMTALAWLHRDKVPISVRSSYLSIGVLFAVAALALGEQRHGWRYWARELLPVPFVPFIFLNLGRLIPLLNPRIYDRELLGVD